MRINSKHTVMALFLWFLTTLSHSQIPTPITVGGYLFPPFVEMDNNKVSGLTLDLINLLNETQSEFHFQFTLTSPKRRYLDFEKGLFDAIFFENQSWSWQERNIRPSKVFLSGGEVFIALAKPNRSQTYFENLKDKKIIGILGYHYQFADNITNEALLNEMFDIRLVNSPSTLLSQIIKEKSEVGIVTYSFLKQQMKLNPKLAKQLIISEGFDQVYQHEILVRNGHTLTPNKIDQLINTIEVNGTLDALLDKYGLTQ